MRVHWPILAYVPPIETFLVVREMASLLDRNQMTCFPQSWSSWRVGGTGEVGRKLTWTLWTKKRRGIVSKRKGGEHTRGNQNNRWPLWRKTKKEWAKDELYLNPLDTFSKMITVPVICRDPCFQTVSHWVGYARRKWKENIAGISCIYDCTYSQYKIYFLLWIKVEKVWKATCFNNGCNLSL